MNISRYVSSAIAEETVALALVHEDLMAQEEKIAQAKERHNEFLKELGLSPLP